MWFYVNSWGRDRIFVWLLIRKERSLQAAERACGSPAGGTVRWFCRKKDMSSRAKRSAVERSTHSRSAGTEMVPPEEPTYTSPPVSAGISRLHTGRQSIFPAACSEGYPPWKNRCFYSTYKNPPGLESLIWRTCEKRGFSRERHCGNSPKKTGRNFLKKRITP